MTAARKQAQKFITSTVGLQAMHPMKKTMLVRIEAYRNADNSVTLKPVSGHNLAPINAVAHVKVSAEEWSDRPFNAYNDTREAIWALELCGFEVSA